MSIQLGELGREGVCGGGGGVGGGGLWICSIIGEWTGRY